MKRLAIIFIASVLAVTFTACKKDKKEEATPSTNDSSNNSSNGVDLTTTASYYFIFQKGNSAIKLEQSVNSIYNGSTSEGGSNDYLMCGGTFSKLNADFSTKQIGAILYGKDYGTCCPTNTETYDAFPSSTGTYGKDGTKTGFILTYLDENNVVWSTQKSTAVQSSSSITITSKAAYSSMSYGYVVAGTFECTFYNDNGDSFKATNGKFKTMIAYN